VCRDTLIHERSGYLGTDQCPAAEQKSDQLCIPSITSFGESIACYPSTLKIMLRSDHTNFLSYINHVPKHGILLLIRTLRTKPSILQNYLLSHQRPTRMDCRFYLCVYQRATTFADGT
jgi:hypothetical protein